MPADDTQHTVEKVVHTRSGWPMLAVLFAVALSALFSA